MCDSRVWEPYFWYNQSTSRRNEEFPTNIWFVVVDVCNDALIYNTKSKINFIAVLFQISKFCSWFEDSVCKEIMATVFQMKQKDKYDDMNDETAFFATLKLAVVRWQFLILEKLTLLPAGEGIWVPRSDHMMALDEFYF